MNNGGLIALAAIAGGVLGLVAGGGGARAEPVPAAPTAVTVVNHSRPTRCAEEDNVDVRLRRPGIAGLRLSAEPPPYLVPGLADRTAPDFSHCDMRGDPVVAATPRRVVLHDGGGLRLVGHTFAGFWRPAAVPVRVGAVTTPGLHLVQLLDTGGPAPVEILVVYPADGYWRAKPLPPADRADTAYGSSFLIGPVEDDGRPLVRFAAIAFDPPTARFEVSFAAGGGASLTVVERSAAATRLAIAFTPPPTGAAAFAALRSMHVDDGVADVAETAWQPAGGGDWRRQPVLAPLAVDATAVRFGRQVVASHNTSAPDLVFDRFIAADADRP